jgi:shikimate dehydrogenase
VTTQRNGRTRLVAIFGWPLTYTLSPVFHNAALRHAGIDAAYLALASQSPAQFKALARGLMASPHFIGANVTNPYKLEALALADEASPAARAIGAANTLVRQRGRWVAHNTDAPGFLAAARQAGAKAQGARVLVLGAGGAARAVAWASASAGAVEVVVLARKLAQAKACAKLAKNKGFGALLSPRNIALASQGATWVVNSLPGADLGGSVAANLARAERGRWAMDISYLPRPLSPFLRQAGSLGYRVMDGLPMLLEQGRLSFELWFAKKPDRALLLRSLRSALR